MLTETNANNYFQEFSRNYVAYFKQLFEFIHAGEYIFCAPVKKSKKQGMDGG
jgi:hypothetical protein